MSPLPDQSAFFDDIPVRSEPTPGIGNNGI